MNRYWHTQTAFTHAEHRAMLESDRAPNEILQGVMPSGVALLLFFTGHHSLENQSDRRMPTQAANGRKP